MFLFLLSCLNEGMLVYEKESESIVYVEQEDCLIVEDTSLDFSDIWVDSFVQVSELDGVDIFWVIDPSQSMYDDQPRIIAGIQHMMSNLPAIGWRLMIISSDYRFASHLTVFPIVPGDTLQDIEYMYNANVNGQYEAGFDAVIEYIDFNIYANTWLRNDAALLMVFVSDENDQSRVHVNDEYEFISWALTKRSNVYLASIVNLPSNISVCTSNISIPNIGTRYINATNYFSGNILDICSNDWSNGVSQAAVQVVPFEWIDLTHTPLDPNWIFVYINGSLSYDWTYNANENRIYFTVIPPSNAQVQVAYNF